MTVNGYRSLTTRACFLPLLATLVLPLSTSSQITVDPPLIAPVSALTVNDLDFLHATTPKWLFTISMRAEGAVEAVMSIEVDAMLAGGEVYPDAVVLTTEPFTINNALVITNIDLRNQTPGIDYYLVDENAKQRLEESALPGGRIPAGMYAFNVTVRPATGGSPTTVTFTIQPTNPTSLQLLFPLPGEQTANTFPLFNWFYDGPRSRISVYEQLPGQSSLEETASGIPHLTATVEANSFQYPASGSRILEAGKAYVWLVEGLSDVSGGSEVSLKSEIRSFTVSSGQTSWDLGMLTELEGAIGPNHKAVFDQIRAEGLSPEGGMYLNGSAISPGDLLRLINLFRQNPDAVSTVGIEE